MKLAAVRLTTDDKSKSPKLTQVNPGSVQNDPTRKPAVIQAGAKSSGRCIEATGPSGLARDESPTTDADRYHWEYHVKRKSWRVGEDEDQAQWYVVGKADYSSLSQANDAAGQEILRERDGLATTPYARQWRRDLDQFDMVNYFVELPNGYFRVHVDRVLRNQFTGRLPSSKAGWLKKTVWDIMQKTTTKSTVEDVLFGNEVTCENTTLEVVDGIFTILDEANREAGKVALALRVPVPEKSLRIEHQLKRQEVRKEIEARLNQLEQQNEAFKETVKVSESKYVELWVQARSLKGPRNV